MDSPKPYLAVAVLCDKALEERDKTISLIRIIDTFYLQAPPQMPLPPGLNPLITMTLFLSFKGLEAKGRYEVKLRLYDPSGISVLDSQQQKDQTWIISFSGEEKEQGANLIVNFGMPFKSFGSYWFEVFLDDELITKVPFRLREPEPRAQ
jgi:hypothetical protein